MRRTYEHGTKARLSFSGGPHAPVNMADKMEEVNVGEKHAGNAVLETNAAPYFMRQVFESSSGLSSPLDPETVQLPAFSILSAMFTGACGSPEKLSLALVRRPYVLRMIVKFAYTTMLPRWQNIDRMTSF